MHERLTAMGRLAGCANPIRRAALLCCFLVLITITRAWAAPSLTATLDRQTVPLGETVTLSLTFEDVSPGGQPSLPALPNLQVVGTSRRNEFIMDGASRVSRQTFDFILSPTQVGVINIPSMQLKVGNQVLATEPLRLNVVPAGQGAAGNTNVAFLQMRASKTEVFVGEPFIAELHLYFQQAQDIQIPQIKAEGFTLNTSQMREPERRQTQVNGVAYQVFIFRFSAVAAKTGLLTLGPAECSLTLLFPVQSSRRRDVFDPFGMFGPQMQRRPAVIPAEPQNIRVLPLPTDGVPPNFNGAVGNYTLSMTAGPTNLPVGDPITVKIQISGKGALDSLALPPQPQWRDFNSYPPTSKVEARDPLATTGTKQFEQIIIPQNHEITGLPPFEFSFFDPEARAYRSLQGPAFPLKITPAASAVAPPPPVVTNTPGQTPPQAADDIVHIRPRLDKAVPSRPPLVRQPWFLALQTLPFAVWLALFAGRKYRENLSKNPRLRRQREVARFVQQSLRQLETLAAEKKTGDFYATLFRLLQEQLGERLDLPASAITEAVIDERLRGRPIEPETVTDLHALFQLCNQARYAPGAAGEVLGDVLPRVRTVISRLQALPA